MVKLSPGFSKKRVNDLVIAKNGRKRVGCQMSMRRFTWLTNGFIKKIENHAHAIAIHYMHYNFGRMHKTPRVTPAMEAGIADHVWTSEEIAKLADRPCNPSKA
jgi:hypothetical protein